MPTPTRRELKTILDDTEELIGLCTGKAPSEFYGENDDGRRTLTLEEIKLFAANAEAAWMRLQAIIRQMR